MCAHEAQTYEWTRRMRNPVQVLPSLSIHIPQQKSLLAESFLLLPAPESSRLRQHQAQPMDAFSQSQTTLPWSQRFKGLVVETHLWPGQRAEGADTVPGGGGEGKVSRTHSTTVGRYLHFGAGLLSREGEWAVCKGEGKKFISWWIRVCHFL